MYTRSPAGLQGRPLGASPAPPRLPDLSRRPGLGDSRFSPNTFQYNARVAFALLPCVAVLLGAGGSLVVATLAVGLMIAYTLDALQFKQGAFVAIWASLFTTAAAIAFSGLGFAPHIPLPLSLLLLLSAMHLVFLCGAWVSLQFKWLQLEHPYVVLTLERLLFACAPITAAAIQAWGLVASVGVYYAPLYLLPLLFALFWIFSLPVQSSFRAKGARQGADEETLVQGRLEAFVHCALLALLPFCFHVAVHHNRLFESTNEICENLLLIFLPFLFLLFASTRGALWWFTKDQRVLRRVRLVNGAFALAIVLACLEIRVVLTSLSPYINLPPPFSYALVTLAVFGLGFGSAAHVAGVLKGLAGSSLVMLVLVVSAIAASIAIGMPWKMLPAPAIAAAYLAHFHSSSSLSSYFIFVASSSLAAAWFVLHQFFFLSVPVGPVSIQAFCRLLVAAFVVTLALPGVALFDRAQGLTGTVLVLDAAIVSLLENWLVITPHYEEGIYPPYLVLATTLAGWLITRRLRADQRVGSLASYLSFCLFLSKLSLLILPEEGIQEAALALLLAISPAFLLYSPSAPKAPSSAGSASPSSLLPRMQPWQALLHALFIFLAVWFSRFVLFDALLAVSGGLKPSHCLLMGSLLLLASLACVPIFALHFPHAKASRRLLSLLLASALLLIAIQPPLPSAWRLFWDEQHFPDDSPDDAVIYGGLPADGAGPTWPAWLLMGVIIACVAASTNAIPISQSEPVRLGFGLAVGSASGLYVAAQFFFKLPSLFPLLLLTFISAALFLVLVHAPTDWSPKALPGLFLLQILLLPLMLLLVGQGARHFEQEGAEGEAEMVYDVAEDTMLQGARTSLLALYCLLFLTFALLAKFKLARMMQEKLGVAMERQQLPNRSPFSAQKSAQRAATFLRSFTAKRLSAEASFLPLMGNAATLLAFSLALFLASSSSLPTSSASPERAIFFIVPILLLLNQDSALMSGLADRRRYFPLTLACSLYLASLALYLLGEEAYNGYFYIWGEHMTLGATVLFLVKNLGLLLLCLPIHAVFNRFMWDQTKQPDWLLLLFAPMGLPGIVLANFPVIRVIGLLGLGYALVQYMISRHVRIVGMKFI